MCNRNLYQLHKNKVSPKSLSAGLVCFVTLGFNMSQPTLDHGLCQSHLSENGPEIHEIAISTIIYHGNDDKPLDIAVESLKHQRNPTITKPGGVALSALSLVFCSASSFSAASTHAIGELWQRAAEVLQ